MRKTCLLAGGLPALFLISAIPAKADPNAPIPVTIYATQSQLGFGLNQVGTSVTVITEKEIQALGAQTAADALRFVPGVSVNQSGNAGSYTQVRIRGSEANHVLLIVDGVRYRDPAGIGFDFSGLLAGDIARIEVLRGPQSGIYGSDAHAGVIAVTTKSGRGFKKPVAESQVEIGSFNTLSTSAFAGGGSETLWGSISASGLKTSGYNVATTGTEKDASEIGAFNLNLGAAPFAGFSVDSHLRYSTRSADYDDSNFFDPSAPPLIDSATPFYGQNDIAGRIAASYRAPGSGLQQEVAWDSYNFQRTALDAFGPFDSEGHRQQATYRAVYGFDTPQILNSSHRASFQASREWVDYTTTFQPFASLETTGFAGEWITSFEDRLFLSANLRHDISDFFADPTTWKFSARYNFDQGTSLHAAVGTGVTNPTLDELFGSSGGFVGNPALLPEESFEWEAGIEQRWNAEWTTGVTYFKGHTENEIRTLFFPVFTAVNDPGISPRQGVEVLATYRPFANLLISGNYTYTDARTSAGLEEIRRPPHSGSIDVAWFFLDGRANLNVGVAYNGPMVDQDFRVFPAPLVRLDNYTLLNAKLSYKMSEQAEAYVKVQNGLDQDYQEVFGFRGQPFSAYAGMKVTLAGD